MVLVVSFFSLLFRLEELKAIRQRDLFWPGSYLPSISSFKGRELLLEKRQRKRTDKHLLNQKNALYLTKAHPSWFRLENVNIHLLYSNGETKRSQNRSFLYT